MMDKETFDDSLYTMSSRPLGITVDKIVRWAGVAGKQDDIQDDCFTKSTQLTVPAVPISFHHGVGRDKT